MKHPDFKKEDKNQYRPLSNSATIQKPIIPLQLVIHNSPLMDHIWSPWRMPYILSDKQDGCVFCHSLEKKDSYDNLIVHRGQHAYVILNRYPYTSGHLMVVPYHHCETLAGLKPETRAEMMELVNQCVVILQKNYFAQGFNIGANLGGAAGAGIPQHIHFHVVPRWSGDTNFMSAIGETRVVPEALEESYERIMSAWKNLQART